MTRRAFSLLLCSACSSATATIEQPGARVDPRATIVTSTDSIDVADIALPRTSGHVNQHPLFVLCALCSSYAPFVRPMRLLCALRARDLFFSAAETPRLAPEGGSTVASTVDGTSPGYAYPLGGEGARVGPPTADNHGGEGLRESVLAAVAARRAKWKPGPEPLPVALGELTTSVVHRGIKTTGITTTPRRGGRTREEDRKMKRRIRVLLCVIATLGASCEDDDGNGGSDGGDGGPMGDPVGSCDIPEGSVCTDYWGDSSLMMYCVTGTWSTDPCDATEACGVCTVDAGDFEARTHYYPGSGDAGASKSVCEAGQGTWEDVGATPCQ